MKSVNAFLKFLCVIAVLCLSTTSYANDETPIENLSFKQLLTDQRELNLTPAAFDELKTKLWQKYVNTVRMEKGLRYEYDTRELFYSDKTMRFSLFKRGEAPANGYPLYIALHGGGNAPASLNDSQWRAMESYYRESVKDGIYIAPRGISNNWNLHFEQESYPLYDKLIESAVLFDNVDPNRVYLVGFSAGGDGVYQIVTRMSERFAAANMSAGHSNGLTFDNLYNTPFVLQVGEYDSAYNRNHVTVENYIHLNDLQTKYHGGYVHDVFVHVNGSHNSWHDNDASRRNQMVMSDPIAWLQAKNRSFKPANTNAIDWMNQYTRQAIPAKLVWDLKIGANRRDYQTGAVIIGTQDGLAQPNHLFYWLDASLMANFPNNGKVVVEMVKASNTISVSEISGVDQLRLLLNPSLIDMTQPVKVEVAGEVIATLTVKQKLSIMTRTLLERSDSNHIYTAEVVLQYNAGNNRWQVQQ